MVETYATFRSTHTLKHSPTGNAQHRPIIQIFIPLFLDLKAHFFWLAASGHRLGHVYTKKSFSKQL